MKQKKQRLCPAKQNVTTVSTALKPTEQLPNTLTVNGMLAKTGILVGPRSRAATQSDTNSTTAQSEKHHRHSPTATAGKTGILAPVSAETHNPNRHLEKTATPTKLNNTSLNNTASSNTVCNKSVSNNTSPTI